MTCTSDYNQPLIAYNGQPTNLMPCSIMMGETSAPKEQLILKYMYRVQWKETLGKCTFEHLGPYCPKGNIVKVKRDGPITRCKGDCQKGG